MVEEDLDFAELPSFPSDVSTAPLLRISLQKLFEEDQQELQRLWKACREVGFFYLDLRNVRGEITKHPSVPLTAQNGAEHSSNGDHQIVSDAYSIFDVAKDFYQLPLEEKLEYDLKDQGSYHGYKAMGGGIADLQGTRDRNEFYNVSKDDILRISEALPSPQILTSRRPLFESYIRNAHSIVTLLLTHLNTLLNLPDGLLPRLHALHSPAGDQVRFIRSPPQPPSDRKTALGAHTDFGSITLLFNRLGGLQILPPSTDSLPEHERMREDNWQYVRPLRGHCIVNLGDAMVKFTRGLLRSNIHRVVNPPGDQADQVRYSVVYFARPTDDVLLKPLEGSGMIDERKTGWSEDREVLSSRDWVLRRALGRRNGEWAPGTENARGVEIKAK